MRKEIFKKKKKAGEKNIENRRALKGGVRDPEKKVQERPDKSFDKIMIIHPDGGRGW